MAKLLLASIDEAYDARSWHGTNLRGSLRGVTREQAAWRPTSAKATADRSAGKPGDDRHNIWELMVHAAYWKYDIRRRLTGEKGRSFAIEGSNFWTRPIEGSLAEWRADLALLQREHDLLRRAVTAFPEFRWTKNAPGKPFTFEGLVRGVAAHDLYHAGQIQLLKRLRE
ncbi:MAG: DinB family protein [Acidobacteriota bacterium]|nr:DinB family protein [Acidobacteriota bacterium]